MNDPFSDDETIFKPEWISWVDESEVPKDKSERAVICAYDPAYTEKDISDFTGWVTLYVSQRERDFGTIYVYEADEKRLSTGEKIDHIFLLESMHQPEAIGIEEVGAQSLSSSMVYIATKLGRYPNIYPMKAGSKSKLVRANSVSQLVQNGVVKFVRGKYPNFVAQLLSFKGDASEHDDMVDAFVYALKIAQSWHLPATETKTEQPLSRIQASRQFHAKGLIHPITGERMDKWKRA
jgi:predicted phage terminase large subunit-like protein